MEIKPIYIDAISALAPNVNFRHVDTAIAEWDTNDTGVTEPTDAEINTKLASMISDWNALAYARNRQAEYPSIAELTVALYDTDDKAAIETKRAAVKAKYPKPS
jgi:hypothetical protein